MPSIRRISVAVLMGTTVVVGPYALGAISPNITLAIDIPDLPEETVLSDAEARELVDLMGHLAVVPALAPLEQTTGRDAGALLNPALPLDGYGIEADAPQWWSEVSLTTDQRRNWLTDPAALPDGDLSVTRALLAYDHWDPASSGAFARYVADPTEGHVFEAPIPNLVGLTNLARLRLAKGIEDGDPLPALQETRHLARLILSADHQILYPLIANGILGLERRAYEAAVEQGMLAPEAWTPLSAEDSHRLRLAVWGLTAVYLGQAPPDAHDRLVAAGHPLLGQCGALAEGMAAETLWRANTSLRWLEPETTARIALLDRTLETSGCALPLVRQHWANPAWSRLESFAGGPSSAEDYIAAGTMIAVLQLPGFRQRLAPTLRLDAPSAFRREKDRMADR